MATLVSVFGGFLAKLALSILSAILEKNKENVEAKKAFLEMTQALAAGKIISVSLHESYASQKSKNEAEVDKILEERKKPAPPAL